MKKVLSKEVAASISGVFGNKKEMSAYFGKWGKKEAKTSYIIDWCDGLLEEYQQYVANLKLLRSEMISVLLRDRGITPEPTVEVKEAV